MKRLKVFPVLLLALCSLLLTACVRLDADVTIKADGKADLSLLYAVMSDDPDEASLSLEEQDEITDFGGKYELYNQDGYVGYKVTAKNISLDKLSDSSILGGDSDSFVIKKEGKTLRIEGSLFDPDDEEQLSYIRDSLGMYGGYMRFTLHLPEVPNESNATSTSDGGKTLTWDLTKMKSGEKMIVEFTLPGVGSGYFVFIGILAAIVLVVVLVVILLLRRKPAASVMTSSASQTFSDRQGLASGQPSENYIYCSKCGTGLPAGTAYCTNCGNLVVSVATPEVPADVTAPADDVTSAAVSAPVSEAAPMADASSAVVSAPVSEAAQVADASSADVSAPASEATSMDEPTSERTSASETE